MQSEHASRAAKLLRAALANDVRTGYSIFEFRPEERIHYAGQREKALALAIRAERKAVRHV